jgi:hypothetical protein
VIVYLFDLTPTLSANLADPSAAAGVWDLVHLVATLQGIVNRDGPRLYLRYVEWDGRYVDDYWLAEMRRPGRWLEQAEIRRIESLEQLVSTFRAELRGAVVYDAKLAALSNVASAFAGAEDLVAVRYDPSPESVYNRVIEGGPRLPVRRQLTPEWATFAGATGKCGAYRRAKSELLESGKCHPAYLGYYIDAYWISHARAAPANHHTLTNHDYFVAKRAFFCDLHCWSDERPVDDPDQPRGEDLRTFTAILATMARLNRGALAHVGGFTPWAFKYTTYPGAGGSHEGVETEWELVRVLSAYNAFLDADALSIGAMANASFFQHFPLKERYAQAPPPASLPQVADADWVMFYVGDYDSAAWLYQRIPDLWDDPQRGRVPLNWAIGPVLSRRAPQAFAYLYETRSANDFFITADNGGGYLNPSMLTEPRISGLPSGVEAWRRHCAPLYRQWDMNITGFVIDGLAPPSGPDVLDTYATFSGGGIALQRHEAWARLHRGMPVIRCGTDINTDEPAAAAGEIVREIASRRRDGQRFHWFRSVLRPPRWYVAVVDELARADSRIRVVGAPEFFTRLRDELDRPRP